MKCTNCGNKIGPDDEFCEKCGMRVEPDIVYEEKDVREDTDDGISGADAQDESSEKAPKKFSKWTTAGIVAGVGIAGAFITAVIANNIGNIFATPDDSVVAQEETTTTGETFTAVPATETIKDKPESAVYSEPGSQTEEYEKDSGYRNGYDEEDTDRDSSRNGSSVPSYSYGDDDTDTYNGRSDSQSNSNDDFYNRGWSNDENSGNTDLTPSEDSSDESPYYYRYGEDTDSSDESSDSGYYEDSGNDQDYYGGDNYGDEIRQYLEDAGDQILEYGEQIDNSLNDTINSYRDRFNDFRQEAGW